MNDSPREKTRQELLAVLEEFNVPVSLFDGFRRSNLEKYLASFSPQKLKEFYLILLEPCVDLATIQDWCPAWPARHQYAGQKPGRDVLRKIRQRLVESQKEAEQLELEQRKLKFREREQRRREAAAALEQQKMPATSPPRPRHPHRLPPKKPPMKCSCASTAKTHLNNRSSTKGVRPD